MCLFRIGESWKVLSKLRWARKGKGGKHYKQTLSLPAPLHPVLNRTRGFYKIISTRLWQQPSTVVLVACVYSQFLTVWFTSCDIKTPEVQLQMAKRTLQKSELRFSHIQLCQHYSQIEPFPLLLPSKWTLQNIDAFSCLQVTPNSTTEAEHYGCLQPQMFVRKHIWVFQSARDALKTADT